MTSSRPPQPETRILSRLGDEKYNEQARLIGIISANWNVLEAEMESVFGAVLGLDYHRSKIVFYAIQNFVTKRDIVSATITEFHNGSKVEGEWIDIQKELKSANDIRNRTVHAIWAEHAHTENLQLRQSHSRGVYSTQRKQYSVHTLQKNADFISAVAARLNQIQLLLRLE